MAVPDFQTLMRPVLVALSDGAERPVSEIRSDIAEAFQLTDEDLREKIPSGRVPTFQNRVGWATTYLYRTGLLQRPRRAVYAITERGRQVLNENPDRVDLKVLAQFDELEEFRQGSSADEAPSPQDSPTTREEQTPEERLERANRELRATLAAELLDQILGGCPSPC